MVSEVASRPISGVIVEAISHETVGVLKKNQLKPHLRKQWCIGELTPDFLWQMETLYI